jgi:hypothetical protein
MQNYNERIWYSSVLQISVHLSALLTHAQNRFDTWLFAPTLISLHTNKYACHMNGIITHISDIPSNVTDNRCLNNSAEKWIMRFHSGIKHNFR